MRGKGDVLDLLLHLADQIGVGTHRLEPHDRSDLPAQVAFGQRRHLEVVDPVPGLGETLDKSAQQRGFPRTGRGDQRAAHAV
jgi:hypothetical protein